MPKARRKSLPGTILVLALVVLAAVLGVYGNKFLQSTQGGGAQTPTETLPTLTESPSTESVEGRPEENLNITQSSSPG